MIPDKYEPKPKTPPPTAYYRESTPTPSPTYTSAQFEATYGFRPDVPEGAVITSVRETPEGYQISYYVRGKAELVRRKPTVGEPPFMQVGQKLGTLEGSLLIQRGYAYEPRKGIYAKYPETPPDPLRPVGIPPFTVLPSKLERTEKGLLERRGWVYEPETKQFYKYETVQPPTWKETTITGQIYTGEIPVPLPFLQLPWFVAKGIIALAPEEYREVSWEVAKRGLAPTQELGAGVIGIGEAWVRPEVPTPIGEGIKRLFGEPTVYETGKVSPFYLAGGLFGTYVEAKAFGWVGGKVWAGVKRVPSVGKLASKVSITWERHVTEPFMKRMPQWIQKRYYGPEYTARIAERGLVWEKKPFIGYAEFYAQIETQLPVRPKPWSHFVFKGGKTTTPMAYTLERALTGRGGYASVVTTPMIIQETRKTVFTPPYRLFETGIKRAGWKTHELLFGFGIGGLAKLRLKETARVRTIKTGKIAPRIRQPQVPKMKQILQSEQIVRTQQVQVLSVKQITKQLQKQTQITTQITLRPPQITKQTLRPRSFRLPKTPRKRRYRKRYGEEWFFKKHPLATAKEVAKDFLG